MRQVAIRAVALVALGGAIVLPSAPFAAERLDIRATSLPPKEVQAVLNAVAEPTSAVVAPGLETEAAIRQHCGGSFTDAYLEQFVALNGGAARVVMRPGSAPRAVYFPPCPKIKAQAKVHVYPGDTLEALLTRELGVGEKGMVAVCTGPSGGPPCGAMTAREATEATMGWAAGLPDPLAGRSTVVLPFASNWTTITLKEGVSVADAIQKLGDAASGQPSGKGLLRLAPSPELSLPRPLTSEQFSSCTPGKDKAEGWPFDRDQVRAAMLAAAEYVRRNGYALAPTVVRIADTGVVGIDRPDGIPESLLAVNQRERHGGKKDRNKPHNGYSGDRYGIAPINTGLVEPLQDMNDWLHGSQVAQLALGGRDLQVPPVDLPIRLNFARLWQRTLPDGSTVNTATISESFKARPQRASVVNLSVGGPNPVPGVLDTLLTLSGERQIAVLAAGNDGRALNDYPHFPASYGAETDLQSSVIVVGAYGPDGRIAAFSNHGRDAVHLLAPGCGLIDPFDASGETRLAGTSFAAPLVSFTAAAIRSYLSAVGQEPVGVNPIQVKTRLRAAIRYVGEDVAQRTRFGGVLDIPAALRVFDDVVRLPDGKLVIGRWAEPWLQELCDGRPLPPERIARIRVEPIAGELPRLHVLTLNDNFMMAESDDPPCTALSDDGVELILEDGLRRSFRWSEMATFISAYDLENRRIALPVARAPEVAPAAARATAPAVSAGGRSATEVRRIQEALADRGLAPGPVDGVTGPQTVEAVRKFQQARGEQPSGVLNERQTKALLFAPVRSPLGDAPR